MSISIYPCSSFEAKGGGGGAGRGIYQLDILRRRNDGLGSLLLRIPLPEGKNVDVLENFPTSPLLFPNLGYPCDKDCATGNSTSRTVLKHLIVCRLLLF